MLTRWYADPRVFSTCRRQLGERRSIRCSCRNASGAADDGDATRAGVTTAAVSAIRPNSEPSLVQNA